MCVPEVEREALRDLVRAREAGKSNQQRARQRLGKFLLRQGLHAPRGTRRWSKRYLEWIAQLQLEQVAQRLALADYLAEVEHAGARVARLDEALGQALAQAPEPIKRLVVKHHPKFPPLYHLKFPPRGSSLSGWGSARGNLPLAAPR